MNQKDFKNLTQENLDRVKSLFPNDKKLQALTLEELIEYSKGKDPAGTTAQTKEESRSTAVIPPCPYALGIVVIDVMFVVSGAIPLRQKLQPETINEVAIVIEPEKAAIEKLCETIADSNSTYKEIAWAIFGIGKLIYGVGMLEAVAKAIYNSLTWWDMALYATLGLGELVAAFATDGAELVAEIVVEIALVGFLISDGAKAVEECG